MTKQPPYLSSATTITRYFHRLAPLGLTKCARLRQSIIQALEDGELPSEDQLPPERELGEMLSISLGTTQKALTGLAVEGYLVRKQGIGTFVGQPRATIQKSWHYRFTDPLTGKHLPVYARLLHRSIVTTGPWARILGPDPAGYIRIDRRVSVGDRFACYSELYLPASRCQPMLELPDERLENVNLKEILAVECGYPTTEAKGAARIVQLDARRARLMNLPEGGYALRVNILGKTDGQAISYQKMFVPPTDCELDIDFLGSS